MKGSDNIKCSFCKKEIEDDINYETISTKKTTRFYHIECHKKYLIAKEKCICCNKTIKEEPYLEIENKFLHKGCEKDYLQKKKLKEDWNKLYEYVRFEILGYTNEIVLSKSQVQYLQQFSKVYSFENILYTFEKEKNNIKSILAYKRFANENDKFKYIMAIIKNNINDVIINKGKDTSDITISLTNNNYYKKKSILNKKVIELLKEGVQEFE